MKRKTEPVEVRLQNGQPWQLVRAAPEPFTCTILDVLEEWHVSGRWWARETTRHYLLVRTDHGTFELCHEHVASGAPRWMLTGIVD